MTTRREALLALPLLCSALHAGAQTSRSSAQRRIAFLYEGNSADTENREKTFLAAMSRLGWVGDKNIAVERAFANEDSARLARLVEELIRKRVEVFVALGNSAPTAVARGPFSDIPPANLNGCSRGIAVVGSAKRNANKGSISVLASTVRQLDRTLSTRSNSDWDRLAATASRVQVKIGEEIVACQLVQAAET